MDYVKPAEIIEECLKAAKRKASLSISEMLVTGALSGVFLGFATSLVMVILAQGLPPIAGAAAFPVGFVILVLLGLELVTGNFALMPQGLVAGQVKTVELLRNWGWVYLGNLLGSLFYASLFFLAITNFGTNDGGAIGENIRLITQKKTLAYSSIGAAGWGTAVVKGILCNWMVTIGTVLAFVSRSTAGKIAAMWLPIMIFFAHGYEHCVVNMYLIPSGMLFGAPVSMVDWWFWNQIPVTLGNIISGAAFTGLALLFAFGTQKSEAPISRFSLTSCTIGCFLILGLTIFSVTLCHETPKHQLEEGLIEPLTKFLPVYLTIFAIALIVTSLVSIVFGSLGILQIIGNSGPLRGKTLATAGIVMSVLTVIPPAVKLPSFVESTFRKNSFEPAGVFKTANLGIFKIVLEPITGYPYLMGMGFQTKYGIVTIRDNFYTIENVEQVKVGNAFGKVLPINKKWLLHKDLDVAIIPEMIKDAKVLEIEDSLGEAGEPVLYVGLGKGGQYLPFQGRIRTIYREPRGVYMSIETAKPIVIGSPIINKNGKVLGLLVTTGGNESLALSISDGFLKDKIALLFP